MAPRRYSAQEIEAVWQLMRAGCGPKEIREMMAENRAGLDHPVDWSDRSLARHMRLLKEQRGEPVSSIDEGQEVDAARAIHRGYLELAADELRDLQKKRRSTSLTPADMRKAKLAASMVAAIEKADQAPKGVQGRAGKIAGEKHRAKPTTLLDQLARSEPAPDVATSNGQGNGDGEEQGEGGEGGRSTKRTATQQQAAGTAQQGDTAADQGEPKPDS